MTAFDEAWYLSKYADVAAAVKAGHIASGHEHYEKFGRAEGRRSAAPIARIQPRLVSLSAVGTAQPIFPAREVALRNICAFSNAADHLKERWAPAYNARRAQPASVELIRLPANVLLSGDDFTVLLGDRLLTEQLEWMAPGAPPLSSSADPGAQAMLNFTSHLPVEDISGECLLVARYGAGTWGHLLIELLPKIAIAERVWPHRFQVVLPAMPTGILRDRVLEAIHLYGVSQERLTLVHPNHVYRFGDLFAITPVYSDHIMHPDVIDLMQNGQTDAGQYARVVLLRNDLRRNISNIDEVLHFLRQHRFVTVSPADVPFREQIRLFRSSFTVLTTLGSTLSGLMFSPDGVRVAILAPDLFADRCFYGIAQMKAGSLWSEVRGPVTQHDRIYENSSFAVSLAVLDMGLSRLGV